MKISKLIALGLGIGAILLCVSVRGEGAEATPKGILREYQRTLDSISTVYAIDAESDSTLETGGGEKKRTFTEYQYRRDGDRIDLRYSRFPDDGQGNKSSLPDYHNRAIINEKDEGIFYYGREPIPEYVVYTIEGRKEMGYARAQMGGGEGLDGFFAHDAVSAVELLEKAQSVVLLPEMESVDGSACYVLDAATDHGHYTLWIDPSHGYLPRKVLIKKGGDNIYGSTPLTQFPSLSEVEFLFAEVQIEEIEGVFVPTSCVMREVSTDPNGMRRTLQIKHKRTNINRHPDFEALGAFKADLPDGIKVHHQEFVDTGVAFEWKHGGIGPAFEEMDVASADIVADQLRTEGFLGERASGEGAKGSARGIAGGHVDEAAMPAAVQEAPVAGPAHPWRVRSTLVGALLLALAGCAFLLYRRKKAQALRR